MKIARNSFLIIYFVFLYIVVGAKLIINAMKNQVFKNILNKIFITFSL